MTCLLTNSQVDKIFSTLKKNNPHPKSELTFINDYTFLVAVVLSARTTDVQVNKATKALFERVQTPKQMLALGFEKLIPYIKSIGLYKNKAKNILALSQILVEKYNSKVPANLDALCALPGVGSKTAKVVLNSLFNKPLIAVDTHVFRVSRRLGLTNQSTVEKVEADLDKTIPKKWKNNAAHWLVLHGRYVCMARKPLCNKCIISKECKFFQELNNDNK